MLLSSFVQRLRILIYFVRESLTVQLTSFICLNSPALLLSNEQHFNFFGHIQTVKQEVSRTAILHKMVSVTVMAIPGLFFNTLYNK